MSEVENMLHDGQLSRQLQELIGTYIMMEEFFMRETVSKVW